MFGPQEDVIGECNNRLGIPNDWGDTEATMRCQLDPGHDGPHREKYDDDDGVHVTVTWTPED